MADLLVFCGALLTLFGFFVLFLFIKRLGILEIEAAMVNDDYQREKLDPQPMIEVKNPFEINVSCSNMGCVEFIVSCTKPSTVDCYWKIKKEILDKQVTESQSEGNSGQDNFDKSLSTFLQNECETLLSTDLIEDSHKRTIIHNVDNIVEESFNNHSFIPDPAICDIVVTMQLTQDNKQLVEENPCSICAMVVGVDLKKEGQNYKAHVGHQYIQSANGRLFKMKKLFLEESALPLYEPASTPTSQEEPDHHLCIVCQLMPISRALIPCGHACLCVLCFDKMNSCPMCRNVITSSFVLRDEPNIRDTGDRQFSEILKRMNPLEIIRGILRAS